MMLACEGCWLGDGRGLGVAGALDPRTLDVMARGQDRPLLGLAIFRVCRFTRVGEVPRAGVGRA